MDSRCHLNVRYATSGSDSQEVPFKARLRTVRSDRSPWKDEGYIVLVFIENHSRHVLLTVSGENSGLWAGAIV